MVLGAWNWHGLGLPLTDYTIIKHYEFELLYFFYSMEKNIKAPLLVYPSLKDSFDHPHHFSSALHPFQSTASFFIRAPFLYLAIWSFLIDLSFQFHYYFSISLAMSLFSCSSLMINCYQIIIIIDVHVVIGYIEVLATLSKYHILSISIMIFIKHFFNKTV